MPQGLQVWDATGNLVVEITDRLTRVLGVVTIPTNGSGYITDANFATGTIWWQVLGNTTIAGTGAPTMAADPANNRISYGPQAGVTTSACNVIYGVY